MEGSWGKNSGWNKEKSDWGTEKNQAEVKRYLATLTGRYCSSDEGNSIRAGYSLTSAPSNNR